MRWKKRFDWGLDDDIKKALVLVCDNTRFSSYFQGEKSLLHNGTPSLLA
jgi:hypothetical protein